MKPRLLVVELWGLGDLVIATPFLRAASDHYAVTLVAKPFAKDLRDRFWPAVEVMPFVAPWTAFRRKYRLWAWPWRTIFQVMRVSREGFDIGISARWDPRDHLLLQVLRARRRIGFPRWHSEIFLSDPMARPDPVAHRYEYWRTLGHALGLELPAREKLTAPERRHQGEVLIHSGAGQPVRVWPLEKYGATVKRLRQLGYRVQVACDPDQKAWWLGYDEKTVATPRTVAELLTLMDRAAVFIGNDSGPSHLAGFAGLPTFTLFGPQLPEWFAPLHPLATWIEGHPCPYKPCSDYCRFPTPFCLTDVTEDEIWPRLSQFVAEAVYGGRGSRSSRLDPVPAGA